MKSGGGFTMVELLVAMFIIVTMSAILLPNYRAFQRQFSLLQAAHILAQDLRTAQEMATSAKELASGEVPPGYGIYLAIATDEQYILYADTIPAGGDQGYDPGEEVATISLGGLIKIKTIEKDSLPPSAFVSINFKGPDPVTRITGDADTIIITIALKDEPSKEQKIFVNTFGLIYVQ